MTLLASDTALSAVDDTIARACDHLLGLQDPAGWWKGELETNVTIDAEDILLREFLGVSDASDIAATGSWIRSQQRSDGTWATFYGGPPDLSTTVEAYVALRIAGDQATEQHMKRAAAYVRDSGGVENARVFTRIWLALGGLWSWHDLPLLPPELIFLPRWFPLNIYDWACWARQTIVPLSIVSALRPVRPLDIRIDELFTGTRQPSPGGFFGVLDKALHGYQHIAVRPLRRAALKMAAEWVIARQEADGSWGGIQPPWVYSLIALHALGYPLTHPVLQRGLEGLERFTIRDGGLRRIEACQSPVWDTALAVIALRDAGVAGNDPALVRAVDWLLGEEIAVHGDWSIRRPKVAPSGWAFEFDNDGYPDTDDTAEVVLALRQVAYPNRERLRAAIDRALVWVEGMRCKDGGWGAFDADNTRTLCKKLPFCDFGAVIDPPSADVTAHIVEMFAAAGRIDHDGVQWLLKAQETDGSWFGRWGANHVYGTGAVVPALVAAGRHRDDPAIGRAVDWLHRHQNGDGGWGEDLRSYRDPAWVGRGTSTASQTAWALLALLAAGDRSAAVHRGVGWLIETQTAAGTWDEPQFTGTGFPGDFYINYHLYRLVFPLSALGRYREAFA